MDEESYFALSPANFFAMMWDCPRLAKRDQEPPFSKNALPNTGKLCHEYDFAEVAMGWHEEGLAFHIQVNQPYTQSHYPMVERGDSVELFIDTRDLKSAGFNTRFCHHFVFLPKSVEDHQWEERTHFRTEDSHPLCDPSLIECKTTIKRDGYRMKIFIPAQCLHGYDPKQCDRIGFTYRINRAEGRPQHFSIVSQEYQIDQQPSLWASIKLM